MAQSKNKKQMSRREREDAAVTRRALLIGGGVLAVGAVASVGYTMLPPAFPELHGNASIDERLAASQYNDLLLRLTGKTERTDVLVIGTTDCSHCRAFVEGGLEDLIAYGEKNALGIAYAPIGMSASSLGSTRALKCYAASSASAPADILREVYAMSTSVSSGVSLEEAMSSHGAAVGVDNTVIDACIAEDPLETTRRMQALMDTFELSGTPMFHVSNPRDRNVTKWFSGYADAKSVVRQIEAARGQAGA
jgi:hypothetical protein